MARCFELIIPKAAPPIWNGKRWTIDDVREELKKHNCKYLIAEHPIDERSSFQHYHVGINTSSDNTYETIAKWFGCPVNSINKIQGHFTSTYALYLAHYGKEGKTPIPFDEIERNFELDYDKLIARIKDKDSSGDLLEAIARGEIRQYQFNEKLSDAFRIKYKRQIMNALEVWADKKMRARETAMKRVTWIYGKAGSGKTTLAKYLATSQGLDFFMSDSGENPFDHYADEPCIILDDVGADNLNGKVLLKLFDPHNKCFTKARYFNKDINAELIIVTSSVDPRTFWKSFRDEYSIDGDWEQLTRRLTGGVIKLDVKDRYHFEFTMYDSNGKDAQTFKMDMPKDVTEKVSTITAEARARDAIMSLGMTISKTEDNTYSVQGQLHFEPVDITNTPFVENDDERKDEG